ncbi:hypothetical protein LIER_30561 [Lithospermum erythrorhizon]|uniref:Uncharacterized protein n=1 Tax=Lithospermum erythrorhizon TaxID=34254 RepID=A0AAV3RQB6_LITER
MSGVDPVVAVGCVPEKGRKFAKLFQSCHMEHVPRERSQEADRLLLATEGYETLPEAMVVEWVEDEVFQTKEIMNNALESEEGPLEIWYQTVLDFLRRGTLPEDPPVTNKIQR